MSSGEHATATTRHRHDIRPRLRQTRQQPLELWLTQQLRPDIAISFETIHHPEGRLVLLTIPSATTGLVRRLLREARRVADGTGIAQAGEPLFRQAELGREQFVRVLAEPRRVAHVHVRLR